MTRDYEHSPDYSKLYPGIEISPEVMEVLKQSDRKIEYMEYDLKAETFQYDNNKQIARFIPSREDSIQRMEEENRSQFSESYISPDEAIIKAELVYGIRIGISHLKPAEKKLIYLRYWKQMTQEETAEVLRVTQQAVSYREGLILLKLKKFLKWQKNLL